MHSPGAISASEFSFVELRSASVLSFLQAFFRRLSAGFLAGFPRSFRKCREVCGVRPLSEDLFDPFFDPLALGRTVEVTTSKQA